MLFLFLVNLILRFLILQHVLNHLHVRYSQGLIVGEFFYFLLEFSFFDYVLY